MPAVRLGKCFHAIFPSEEGAFCHFHILLKCSRSSSNVGKTHESEATAHAGTTRASRVKFTRECIHVPGTEVPEHASQLDAAFARSALVCCRITRELRHSRPNTPSSSTLLVGRGRSCRIAVIGRLWSYHNHKRYRNHRSRARVSKRFSTGLAT
jgi:hypothetical protein